MLCLLLLLYFFAPLHSLWSNSYIFFYLDISFLLACVFCFFSRYVGNIFEFFFTNKIYSGRIHSRISYMCMCAFVQWKWLNLFSVYFAIDFFFRVCVFLYLQLSPYSFLLSSHILLIVVYILNKFVIILSCAIIVLSSILIRVYISMRLHFQNNGIRSWLLFLPREREREREKEKGTPTR